MRCGECAGCTSSNCLSCKYCRDNPKYGGPGKLKKACVVRKCINMQKKSETEINKPAIQHSKYVASHTQPRILLL